MPGIHGIIQTDTADHYKDTLGVMQEMPRLNTDMYNMRVDDNSVGLVQNMEMNRVNLMASHGKRSQLTGGMSMDGSNMSKMTPNANQNAVGLKDNSFQMMRRGLSDGTSNEMGDNQSLPSFNT